MFRINKSWSQLCLATTSWLRCPHDVVMRLSIFTISCCLSALQWGWFFLIQNCKISSFLSCLVSRVLMFIFLIFKIFLSVLIVRIGVEVWNLQEHSLVASLMFPPHLLISPPGADRRVEVTVLKTREKQPRSEIRFRLFLMNYSDVSRMISVVCLCFLLNIHLLVNSELLKTCWRWSVNCIGWSITVLA